MCELKKSVGFRIKKLRNKYKWSQEDLAHRANINRTYVGQIERGEKSATIDSLEKICNAFDITLEELFKYLQSSTEYKDNATLCSIITIINSLSVENQKVVLDIISSLLNLSTI